MDWEESRVASAHFLCGILDGWMEEESPFLSYLFIYFYFILWRDKLISFFSLNMLSMKNWKRLCFCYHLLLFTFHWGCKKNNFFVQYIQPHENEKLAQVELLVIDEAAAIPLPVVKSLLGPYLVFLSSTVNGYIMFFN